MKRSMLWPMLAMTATALLVNASMALAQDAALNATLSGPAAPVAKDGPYYVYDLAGSGTTLGPCAGVFENHYSNGFTQLVGFTTITAASGDSLNILYTQSWNGTEWVGQYTIAGGTGRFANATGSGNVDAAFDATHTVVAVIFNGTISF